MPEGNSPLADHDLLEMGESSLTPLERAQIYLVRASLRPGALDRAIRLLQRTVGQWWIRAATARLRHGYGLEHLPPWNRDHPLGPAVNGVMSFFAMYPPIFREKKRAALNLASLDEVAGLLRRGGFFVGLHPEGMRKKDDDPYTFLPAQNGVGRVIHKAPRVPVVPVFVNGLGNDLVKQVAGGVTGRGPPIHIVFGAPVEFGALLRAPGAPKTYRRIAEKCLEAIGELGQQEKAIRAASGSPAEASRKSARFM